MSKISLLFKSLINHNYIIKNKTFSLDNKHVNHINNNIDNINTPINNNSNNIKHYHYNNTRNNSGFSLIELSIVLIIIGILIIGAIRGYALITASRIITLTNELTQYAFAAEQFSAKYGNLPGIIDNPQKILGPTAKSKIDDDKIDTFAINESANVTNAESINFFNHLYLSGLLGESSAPFVGTNEDLNSRSEITKDSNYYPTLRSLKSMFIYVRGDDINGNYNKLNRLTVSNYSNSILGINADLIFGLDNKVDDGLPLSGLISIVPMKISNYGSDDKSSSYNNRNNRNNNIVVYADNTVYTSNISNISNNINNIIDYYLLSGINSNNNINNNNNTNDNTNILNNNIISLFNIINTANAEDDLGGYSNDGSISEAIPEPEPSLPSISPSISSSSVNSCLILDKSTNEIKYNTKGKNCFILRNIDSTQQNKITDLGMNGATGESCKLLNRDNYPNAESVAGTTMLNGSKKTIKCNDGYSGNITITCNEGHPIHSGDAQCTFNGCKKYNNNIINNSLNAILTTNDVVNWDNINEEDKNNLSSDDGISYNKDDVIATLTCKEKEGYSLKEGSDGYSIKCNGNDDIVVENNGGCEYVGGNGCIGFPEIDKLSYINNSSIVVRKRTGCTISQNASNVIYNDTTFMGSNAGSYTLEYLKNKRFINGAIIDADCQPGYHEQDSCKKNDSIDDDLGNCTSGVSSACWHLHYYECKNNQWVKRGSCEVNTCSISNLTSEILGNEFVKTIIKCNDETCSVVDINEIIDVTTEEGKSKTYDRDIYITINTCNTGYSVPENKRIIRCGESGKWELKEETKNNVCMFNKCNEMSAVFDTDGYKISKQLYDMTYSGGSSFITPKTAHNIEMCRNDSITNSDFITLSPQSINFTVDNGVRATCVSNSKDAYWFTYVCTEDTVGINNYNSYWKINKTSCDLTNLQNIGYNIYLKKGSSLIPISDKIETQSRFPTTNYQSYIKADYAFTANSIDNEEYQNFSLHCNKSTKVQLEKRSNSCTGFPTLIVGSQFKLNNNNIIILNDALINMNTFKKEDTMTVNSNATEYLMTNGFKMDAECENGYIETDKNGLTSSDTGYDLEGHHYECIEGTWTAMGSCTLGVN